MKTLLGLLTLAAATSSFLNVESAWGFGTPGADGWSGDDGSSGRDGQDVTLVADGSQVILNLSGADGNPGTGGMPGEDASGCYQPTPNYSVQGADGGDGGAGADGGSGGRGGDLTVYYERIEQMRNIHVMAAGGRGGGPGGGAPGGFGCRCTTPSWEGRECDRESPTGDRECFERRFYCTEGRTGRSGAHGAWGAPGRPGELRIIRGQPTLPPARQWLRVDLAELAQRTEFPLSRHAWESRTGARSILAPGSSVGDTYHSYAGTIERLARIRWEASRPPTEFAGIGLSLSLEGDTPVLELGGDLWTDLRAATEGETTTFAVLTAIRPEESNALDFQGIRGSGEGLVAEFSDRAKVSSLVTTSVWLRYESRSFLSYPDRFVGEVPRELISVEADRVRVALGRLPLKPEWTRKGRTIRLELALKRALGGKSSEYRVPRTKMRIGEP